MKSIKVEWCENFIKAAFRKLYFNNGGIEINCFWDMAEKSGLWVRGTCGSPMTQALSNLTTVESVTDGNGHYLYSVFKLIK